MKSIEEFRKIDITSGGWEVDWRRTVEQKAGNNKKRMKTLLSNPLAQVLKDVYICADPAAKMKFSGGWLALEMI